MKFNVKLDESRILKSYAIFRMREENKSDEHVFRPEEMSAPTPSYDFSVSESPAYYENLGVMDLRISTVGC